MQMVSCSSDKQPISTAQVRSALLVMERKPPGPTTIQLVR
jgi:hypothetical protein